LRDVRAGLRAERLAVEVEAQAGECRVGEARAPVRRRRPVELDRVAALGDPARAKGLQALADVDVRARIRVGARRVVDDDRGFTSEPNEASVSDCAISRIGTRRSGREPSTWILRDIGSGATAAASTCASRA